AVAGVAGAGRGLGQALADLGHLGLEQLHHDLGGGAADEQLRAARLAAHVVEVAADAVAGAHDVARDRLVLGDEAFGVAAEVNVDVAALHALDHAGHQLADAVLPGVHDLLALGLAHALHEIGRAHV